MEEFVHEYILHIDCATGCGKKLHIKPKQKVSKESKRVPRGYMCSDCKKNVQDVEEINVTGEKINA